MAFDYSYTPEEHMIVLTGSGIVTMDDRFDCLKRMMEDSDLPEEAEILIDVCGVSNTPSSEDMPDMIQLIGRLHSRFHSRIAILNTTPGHVTLSNLIAFSAERSGASVKAFVSEAEAREWLGHRKK